MHWKRRDASERILINFEKDLKKKHALEEEGRMLQRGLLFILVSLAKKRCFRRAGMLQRECSLVYE